MRWHECRMSIKSIPWKFRPISYSPLNQAGLTRRPWRLSGRSWRMSETQQMSPIHDTYVYGCKTSLCCRGVWHSCPTTRNEAVDISGQGNMAGFLYLLYIYIYINIVPPLGTYISRSWGAHILYCCWFIWSTSTVIIRLYIYIQYIYMYIYICIYIYVYIYVYIYMYIYIYIYIYICVYIYVY